MPKSKRNKVISLSKTTKKGFELKKNIVSQVQKCCDEYATLYLFSVENVRNQKVKEVREKWRTSRFFFGKNKVMALGLGKTKEEEYKENLHEVTKRLKGDVGLMFTNEPSDVVEKWFNDFSQDDFARSGNKATETVILPEGELDVNTFQHSMEPSLRALGLPTTLKKGIIHLTQEYKVCTEGDVLTPEQCRILKLFSYTLVQFHIVLKCVWHSNGKFSEYENKAD